MKRICLIVLVICLLPGCATNVVDGWATRADRGIDNAADNDHAFVDRIRADAETERATGLKMLLDVLKKEHAAKKLDAKTFDGYEERLTAWLDTTDQRRVDLDASEKRAIGNLEEIRKAVAGMIAASKAFGEKEDVNRRLDRIEDLMRADIGKGK